MSKQHEALRLAGILDDIGTPISIEPEAADKLRSQHALIEELVKALREVDGDLEIEGYDEDGAYRAPVRAVIAKAEAQG